MTEIRDFETAKKLVIQVLDCNGTLDLIKSQLRAQVFTALQNAEKDSKKKQIRSKIEQDSVFIVKNFLISMGLCQTASVLDVEWSNKIEPSEITDSISKIDEKSTLINSLLKEYSSADNLLAKDIKKSGLLNSTEKAILETRPVFDQVKLSPPKPSPKPSPTLTFVELLNPPIGKERIATPYASDIPGDNNQDLNDDDKPRRQRYRSFQSTNTEILSNVAATVGDQDESDQEQHSSDRSVSKATENVDYYENIEYLNDLGK